jgi:predicted AAA+ superfamily ATPase
METLELTVTLTPSQKRAADKLLKSLATGPVTVLWGAVGMGKTSILQQVQASHRAILVETGAFLSQLTNRHPLAVEEAFLDTVRHALASADTVLVDDLHLVTNVVSGCGNYPRTNLLDSPASALLDEAALAGKKLVFATSGNVPEPISQRAYFFTIEDFEPEDYAAIAAVYLRPEQAVVLDFVKVHRFARKLNAHQLKSAGTWLNGRANLDTEGFIEYLRSVRLVSNVDLSEVQKVDLRDLRGIDDVIESLEANVVLALENDVLAAELDLKPKRGILLAGPPGTGKTTIGRALAHRLKGKFFLIDGTFISGTHQFYARVMQVFEAAKQNAPAVIFIDDTDVIFEDHDEFGLYRYLLTMLDGLESESAGRICVMMTAMDVGCLPPAMVRSGRIELWLETRLPDEAARTGILCDRIEKLAAPLCLADPARLAAEAEGLTGADLKRVVEDGKALFAYDKARSLAMRPAEEYFAAAIATVRDNKRLYDEAESRARERRRQQR